MLNKLLTAVQGFIIAKLGRDRLEYLASNTMNVVTQSLDQFIWSYDCQAKVVAIRQETADTKTFVLLPNQHFQQPKAGQHIELAVHIDGEEGEDDLVSRCYTLSHINNNTVSITVKHHAQGKLSNWLHTKAKVGDTFKISSPRGRFVYRKQHKLLFICAGSGITPGYAMLNDLLGQHLVPDIAFYYRSRNPQQTIFQQALAATGKVDFSYSQQDDRAVMLDQLAAYEDIKQRHIYLCGPQSFKDQVLTFLESIGYDFNMLEVEQFTIPANASTQVRKFDEDVTVRLTSQNISFVIKAQDCGQSILEAAEAQGVQMEHGCRTGMCGTCRTNLVSGSVSGNQLGKTIYPCTAYAASRELVLE